MLQLPFFNFLPHCTTMVRYSPKMKELYHYNYTWAHDNELWLRLVFDTPPENEVVIRSFNKPVCGYRKSLDSMNKKNRQNKDFRDF